MAMLWMFCVLQTEHLRLLEGAHAPVGAGHEHAHALFAAHGVFGRAAGVAAGGAQDVRAASPRRASSYSNRLPSSCMAMSLKASVGPLDRASNVQTGLPAGAPGAMAARAKDCQRYRFWRTARAGRRPECRRCRATESQTPARRSPVRPGHLRSCGQASALDLRVALGQVQAAIGSQAFEQDVAKAFAARRGRGWRGSASVQLLFANARDGCQHRWAGPWICARAASMSPSRVSWVRMIRSVWVDAFATHFIGFALQHRVDADAGHRQSGW